jgi:hypothetical protein
VTALLQRPDWFFGPAMNADPNDATAVPTWTDMTAKLRGASALARGRQFELGVTLAADPDLVVRDPDELLNPENTAGAFYGTVLPYRSVLWLGMWPNVGSATASAGNLLNAKTWRVPYDCGFESYTAGAAVPWITAVGGTAPVVGTTTPRAGVNDLTYAVLGTATVQGVSWQIPCIPGRQYTLSAYVRQSSASTQGIYVDATAGTTTVTTGAYVRLTVTFTATQPYHTGAVKTSGTAVAGTVLIDDIQHEQGSAATTAVTTGSVIYPVLRNLVESYVRTWGSNGFEGYVTMPCVDTSALLSAIAIPTEYVAAVTATAPTLYYPLSDGSNTVAFLDRSGNGGPSLGVVDNLAFGGSGVQPQSPIAIPGDADAVGVQMLGTFGGAGSCLEAGGARTPFTAPLVSGGAFSMSWWAAFTDPATAGNSVVAEMWFATGTTSRNSVTAVLVDAATVGVQIGYGSTFDSQTGALASTAGAAHLWTMTFNYASATSLTYALWVDGTQLFTRTVNPTTLFGSAVPLTGNTVGVGGAEGSGVSPFLGAPGTYADLATWNRLLSNTEIATLWSAGLGYAGETSGARLTRHLALGGYAGVTPRISAGSTIMGPPTYSPTIDLQTDATGLATAEGGCEWIAPDGAPVFEGRRDRWLRLTPSWTLGENVAGGEIPYEGDIEYAYDGFYLYGDVTVSRNNGTTAVGGSAADITTAHKRFFGKAYDQSSDFATDQQAQDAANWIFYTHNRPASRIARITVVPASNPALWPFVLGVEIGQRIRVNRRPKAANAGAGITVTLDFFVENVTHDGIDMDAGTWETVLLLSPIGSVTSQTGLTLQPWIVEDPVLGQLDVTAVLAW